MMIGRWSRIFGGRSVGRPGVLKTPALTEATKPLRRLEAEARRRHEDALKNSRPNALVAEVQAERREEGPERSRQGEEARSGVAVLARDVAQAAAPPEPILRRYTTSDPTVEKLGELLRDHGSIGLIRDELTGWLRSFEKSDRQCDRAFYLEGWNGNGLPFTYDRIGRGNDPHPEPLRVDPRGDAARPAAEAGPLGGPW